jgi:hypothetical protein
MFKSLFRGAKAEWHPRHIDREGWEDLKEFYKEELNNGKDFKPDETKRATQRSH